MDVFGGDSQWIVELGWDMIEFLVLIVLFWLPEPGLSAWSRLPTTLEEDKCKNRGFLGSQGSGGCVLADILFRVLLAASSAVSCANPAKWGYENLHYVDGIPFPDSY